MSPTAHAGPHCSEGLKNTNHLLGAQQAPDPTLELQLYIQVDYKRRIVV